jgi:cell division protein FtsN
VDALAVAGVVFFVVAILLLCAAWVVGALRKYVKVTVTPAAELPAEGAQQGEGVEARPTTGGHSFALSHSGVIGHPTPEQQAILDQLQAGAITPEQAAEQLGGKLHGGAVEMHFSLGGHEEEQD